MGKRPDKGTSHAAKGIEANPDNLQNLEDFQRLQHFTELINTTISLRAADVSKRQYSHWKKEGLVNSAGTERGWVKLNLYDYLWVKIVQELRAFGVSLPVIKTVKEHLYADCKNASRNKLASNVKAMMDVTFPGVSKLTKDLELSETDLNDIIADPKSTLPYFTKLGIAASGYLLNGNEVYILILRDKDKVLTLLSGPSWTGINKEYKRYSQIRIPVHAIIKTYFANPALKRFAEIFGLLSKEESAFYEAATRGQLKSAEILTDTGETHTLFPAKKVTTTDMLSTLFRALINKEYAEIILHLNNFGTIKLKNRMLSEQQK